MVGTANEVVEDVDDKDYVKFLKFNNITLAKALTVEKLQSKQYLDEVNLLQTQLHSSTLLNLRYESVLKDLLTQSKDALLPSCIQMSKSISQIIQLCSDGVNLSKKLKNDNKIPSMSRLSLCTTQRPISPGVSNKTRAVQPMVAGHIIYRPVINLRRLNETSTAQIESTNETNEDNHLLEVDELEEDPDPENNTETTISNDLNNLSVVTEGNEADESVQISLSVNNLREPRIIISPLAAEILNSQSPIRNNIHEEYDPLEGPSNLLDNRQRPKTTTRPTYIFHSSDSEDEERPSHVTHRRMVQTEGNGNEPMQISPSPRTITNPSPAEVLVSQPLVGENAHNPAALSNQSTNYDPLEGSSNLLDNRGFIGRRTNKSRQKYICHFSDSEEEDWDSHVTNRKKIEKSKPEKRKKRESSDEKLVKKVKNVKKPNIATTELVVVLHDIKSVLDKEQKESHSTEEENKAEEENINYVNIRSRRQTPRVSLKETSLKCKLRRK